MKYIVRFYSSIVLLLLLISSPLLLAQQPQVIRIASPDVSAGSKHAGLGTVNVLYANKWLEQEFAKKNIKVQWLFFKGAGPAINEALANGQVDFAILGDFPAIIAKSAGLDTQLLLASGRASTSYLAVRSDLNITKLSDLKGKRVGFLRGGADELGFIAALQSQGLSIKDIRIVNMDFSATTAALAAKRIDASWGPLFFGLRDKGVVKLALNSNQLNGAGSGLGVVVGRGAFIKQYPEQTQQFITQVVRSAYWLSQEKNREAQINLFANQASFPSSVYREILQAIDLKFANSPLFDAYYINQLQGKVTLAKENNLIRNQVNVQTWLNPKFLNQALNQLKLNGYWQPVAQYQHRIQK
ncbi:ABC transporter substrate-binding protein [Acinetobacter larvae]|uniref:Aryl sulfate ester ABC transporter n=1 Tax=Acinetobacter larvae TaxID=1789224 RepID=A0A1B2LYC1_9GAMM|nr:ABC transporter substrate-binding protein [Acinetobacter larvae]AOA57879.1 aryl sulfate ester ABC transporter [Acinetobacter larvae]